MNLCNNMQSFHEFMHLLIISKPAFPFHTSYFIIHTFPMVPIKANANIRTK